MAALMLLWVADYISVRCVFTVLDSFTSVYEGLRREYTSAAGVGILEIGSR